MSPQALVEELAGQHDAHLRWLRARLHGRIAGDEIEDVLQGAYARALTSLSGPAGERPRFEHPGQAAAWLRAVALNLAHDVLRERHGRAGAGRVPRPAPVTLDDCVAGRLVADVDIEDEVLGAVEREACRPLVLEAIAGLDPRHRQILQLRYGRDLNPAAVMLLVGLDRRQWDGRHTRALKAFGRALSRLQVSRDCRRTRMLLRRAPGSLLQPAGEPGDHIASCVSCAAFSTVSRFAMGALPLPLTIEAWRLDALDVLSSPSSSPPPVRPAATDEDMTAAVDGAVTHGTPVTPSAALVATAGALAVAGALALANVGGDGFARAVPERPAPAVAGPRQPPAATWRSGTRLAVHHTSRQALERSAREMARRRAQAAHRSSAGGSPRATRVADGGVP